MTQDLPMHLKRIELLPSALDIIRYLNRQPEHEAVVDDICDDLDIGDIRFGKAIRRLVTLGYVQMNAHLTYGLTHNGERAAQELATYDHTDDETLEETPEEAIRRVYIAVPRSLVAGQTVPVQIGFPEDTRFHRPIDVVLRLEALNADISQHEDKIIKLGQSVNTYALDMTPEWYDQARLKLQVFQLSADGEDLYVCGGMYVDLTVMAEGEPGETVAFAADLAFEGV